MTTIVCGIPMVHIPHPQTPWLEGVNPITNLQWKNGVEPLMGQGAKYCLVETDGQGETTARQFRDLRTALETIGYDHVPKGWDGKSLIAREIPKRGVAGLFQWFPVMSRSGFDGNNQPVVDVSWHHAKAWTLVQGAFHLLTEDQWNWSARGGERHWEYATARGGLFDSDGRKLAHCSARTKETATVDVDDARYLDGPFGLRHKTGNVYEWVEKNFGPSDYFDSEYFLRGGSWRCTDESYLRNHYHYIHHYMSLLGAPLDNFGFRVCTPRERKLAVAPN